jgi:hypothetical protein
MFTTILTLTSGTRCPLTFYGFECAKNFGLDCLRVPDTVSAEVINEKGELLWMGVRK